MDFAKLKDGVVALSSFLIGHLAWLAMTLYCVWVSLSSGEVAGLRVRVSGVVDWLAREDIKSFLETFALRPLVAPLVFFGGVFILHAHRKLLSTLGGYVPPELVWHYLPGMRDIDCGRWAFVLRNVKRGLTFRGLRRVIEARYSAAVESRRTADYASSFKICKALVVVNFVLALRPSHPYRLLSVLLGLGFAVAGTAMALLDVYHRRNSSRWAIDDIFRQLLADAALEQTDGERVHEGTLLERDRDEINSFVKADRKTPVVSLGWTLPLIGSTRILYETLMRRQSDERV